MTGVQTCALRSEEHTSELQSHDNLVCRLLLEKKQPMHAPPSSIPAGSPLPASPARVLRPRRTTCAHRPGAQLTGGCLSVSVFFFLIDPAPPETPPLPLPGPFPT